MTLKWEGGYRSGRAKREEGDGEKCNTTQFFISQYYFFLKEKESRAHHKKSEQFLLLATLVFEL